MVLVARYKLEGNANDETGTYNGTATSVTYTTGKQGQAGSFNGTSSRIACGTIPALAGNCTIAAWVYPLSYGGGPFGRIIDNTSTLFFANGTNSSLRFTSNSGTTTANSADFSLPLNTWSHVVVTRTGTTAQFYVNGATSGIAQNAGTIGTNNATQIGGRLADNARNFDGLIDDVRIYDNALSAADVLSLYNSYNSASIPGVNRGPMFGINRGALVR